MYKVGDDIAFPPLLLEFERKVFQVTLVPTYENIRKLSNVYQAKKLIHPAAMGDSCNAAMELSPPLESNSLATVSNHNVGIMFLLFNRNMTSYIMKQKIGCSDVPIHCSPPTEKSSNRPRARKNKEVVKIEVDEHTPIAKLMRT